MLSGGEIMPATRVLLLLLLLATVSATHGWGAMPVDAPKAATSPSAEIQVAAYANPNTSVIGVPKIAATKGPGKDAVLEKARSMPSLSSALVLIALCFFGLFGIGRLRQY